MKKAFLRGIKQIKRNFFGHKKKANLIEKIEKNTISYVRLKKKARTGFLETERGFVWKAIINHKIEMINRQKELISKRNENKQKKDLLNSRLIITFIKTLCLYIEENKAKDLVDKILSTEKDFYFPLKTNKDRIIVFVFSDLIEDHVPSLLMHIRELQKKENEYEPEWNLFLLDLFFDIFPQNCFCRLFDSYLVEGYKVIYRYSLAHVFLLMNRLLNTKTGKEFNSILKEKKTKKEYIEITEKAFEIKITRGRIEHHRKVYSGIDLVEEITTPLESNLIGAQTITEKEIEIIRNWIPYRLKLSSLDKIFSTKTNGHSIKSFYSKCEKHHNILIVIKTIEKSIFGVFLPQPLNKRKKKSFFGTGETFLFSLFPKTKKYPWCQDIRLMSFIFADNKSICIGGGSDSFSIWIGCGLDKCQSFHSAIFNNPPLTKGIAKIEVLEVFCFRS